MTRSKHAKHTVCDRIDEDRETLSAGGKYESNNNWRAEQREHCFCKANRFFAVVGVSSLSLTAMARTPTTAEFVKPYSVGVTRSLTSSTLA